MSLMVQQNTHPSVVVTNSLPDDWDDLVQADPYAEYTHTSHWLKAACHSFPHTQALVLTVRQEGRLVAGLNAIVRKVGYLKRLDSSLEGTSGGPVLHHELADEVKPQLFAQLVTAFQGRRKSNFSAVGLALNSRAEAQYGPLLRQMSHWTREESPTAVVSLAGGLEDVEKNKLVMNKRNERNRGLRRGAKVFATKDPAWLDKYYPLYLQAAQHWGITPVPLQFLQDLLQVTVSGVGDAFFTCVVVDDKVIGGHLNLHFGAGVFAWNGVTDPAYARTHFPATLCFWGDMVEACRRQAQWLDFGASGVASTLLTFKKYFGAEMWERGYYTSYSAPVRAARNARQFFSARLSPQLKTRWHDSLRRKP